ncbi:MAG: integrase core domain-containing protein [Ardenticatenaceae bacterium]|nr:integrase core domain-containing protein [Ardenticatenaceae bacterium]
MRRERTDPEGDPYQLYGAAAIHYELAAVGNAEVPPIRTIHYWLKAAGLVPKRSRDKPKRPPLPIPIPQAKQANDVHQLDLKGPIRLKGSSAKHYLVVLRDRFTRRCALEVVESKAAEGIVNQAVAAWQHVLGVPATLQLDNALEFRGSNKYPRSFGHLIRLALDLGIEPVFNPVGEPWRNGCVERFNGFLTERLLTIRFDNLDQLRAAVARCQTVCNRDHRLTCLDGRSPAEAAAEADITYLDPAYRRHLDAKSLPQDQGFVSFIRLVRRSGRITLGAKDRFMVDPELAYSYVLARVDVAKQLVTIFQDDRPLVTYDFSKSTIGAWAHGLEALLPDEQM